MSRIWRAIASVKQKAHDALQSVNTKIQEKGGVSGTLEDAVKSAARTGATAVGHVARTVEGAIEQYRVDDTTTIGKDEDKTPQIPEGPKLEPRGTFHELHDKGLSDPSKYGDIGERVAGTGINAAKRTTHFLADVLRKGKGLYDSGSAYAKEQLREHTITPKDREYTIGCAGYVIEKATTLKQIGEVKEYMQEVSKLIPLDTSGRGKVLGFIAENAIINYEKLQQEWGRQGKDEVNAWLCVQKAYTEKTKA